MDENVLKERLSNILNERGISQKWLADAANTKEATISRYVNGVNKSARLEILHDMAKALHVTTDYLLGLSDVPYPKESLSAEETVVLAAFNRTAGRDRTIVMSVLEGYMTPAERGFISPEQQEQIG